jgi:putative transposase
VKFACIARLQGEFPVRLMCRLLDVSPAGFYSAQHRPPSAHTRADQQLRVEIRVAHQSSQQRYGAPKIHAELRAQGTACGRHRVARLMREDGLRGCRPHPFRVTTTQSAHSEPIAPNVLARRFSPEDNRERDRVWVADITYLPTREGWLYLAAILDLASRRVVGWSAAPHLEQSLVLGALGRALALRQPRAGLLHHSDRGAQYASGAYQTLLHKHGAICSMSRAGNCWDNAVMESFFATLKTELVHGARWATRAAACRDLAEYIDRWYNHQRRHAVLGYRSPVDYERTLAQLRSA